MSIAPKDFQLPFVKKEQVAKDAWRFYFDKTSLTDFSFVPGQYVKMFLDIPSPDERGTSRSFSIVSSPLDTNVLSITTKIGSSAFKQTLAMLVPGTQVKFFGPMGRFILNGDENRPHIFLAGGIGITPFHSMLLYAAAKKLSFPIMLFVSFSTIEEMVFYDGLMKIAEDYPTIKVVYTITQPEVIPSAATKDGINVWTGETGRISADLIKKYAPEFMNSLFYISGPPVMVDAMLVIVQEMGVPEEQVRKEKFIGY